MFRGILMSLLVVSMCGCNTGAGVTLSSGRSISVQSDTLTLSLASSGDVARIHMGGIEVVVEPTALIVNGDEVETIDAAVKKVVVVRSKGQLTVTGDGTVVYSQSLPTSVSTLIALATLPVAGVALFWYLLRRDLRRRE